MGLETGTYINDLVSTNPLSSDPKSQGDDHIRFIKSSIKSTFPNITGAVNPTHTELNYVAGVTSAIQTQLGTKVTSGGALGTPSSGTLSSCTVDGTDSVGFRNIPQNSKSDAYTCVLADSGKHIYHPNADTTARTWTIPANSSVAYPLGTAITFINGNTAGVITIACGDTLRFAGTGSIGNRTLGTNGVATAVKVLTTEWVISGTGLT